MKSLNEIDEAIALLEKNKGECVPQNFFGESNTDKLDAGLQVLQDDLDENAIYEKYPEEEDDGDGNPEREFALEVQMWRDDDDEGEIEDFLFPLK